MARFGWDPAKDAANRRKHGIAFAAAARAWDDEHALVVYDRFEGGEDRYHLVGRAGAAGVVAVVHAYPDPEDDDLVRIVSARPATRAERRRHERG